MNNEIWKDVVGYEGLYLVSNTGRVISCSKKWRELFASPSKTGYLTCGLGKLGKTTLISVHRIVAKAFIPNVRDCREVNHKDGNKSNNDISNLEWVTRQENMTHAKNMGLLKGGRSKITKNQAVNIRQKLNNGHCPHVLAKKYRLTYNSIVNIRSFVTWRHA